MQYHSWQWNLSHFKSLRGKVTQVGLQVSVLSLCFHNVNKKISTFRGSNKGHGCSARTELRSSSNSRHQLFTFAIFGFVPRIRINTRKFLVLIFAVPGLQ